jgi:hypothetical protein
MATIWVVEQGEYSDYRVVGVFSSKENAQQIRDAVGDDATVAEWTLDPGIEDMNAGRKPFRVFMLRDGTVEHVREETVDRSFLGGWDGPLVMKRGGTPFGAKEPTPPCLNVTVWASDAEHATKITNEHRTRLIASGEWDAALK